MVCEGVSSVDVASCMQQVVGGGVVKGVEQAEVVQWVETVATYTRQFGSSKVLSKVRSLGIC